MGRLRHSPGILMRVDWPVNLVWRPCIRYRIQEYTICLDKITTSTIVIPVPTSLDPLDTLRPILSLFPPLHLLVRPFQAIRHPHTLSLRFRNLNPGPGSHKIEDHGKNRRLPKSLIFRRSQLVRQPSLQGSSRLTRSNRDQERRRGDRRYCHYRREWGDRQLKRCLSPRTLV